jgi:hypothetical protein
VREYTLPQKGFSCARSAGFGLQVLDTTEGVLGPSAVRPLREEQYGVLWLVGKIHDTIREERVVDQRIGRFRRPTRACLRVTKRASEVDTVW